MGKTRIRERLGIPIKKLTTAMQEAMHVRSENQLSHVMSVEIIAIATKTGNHTMPLAFFGSRFTNTSSLTAAIMHTTAPENADIKQ